MSMEKWCLSLINKMGEDNFKKVQSAKIGIAGAGGLGSNCALNLVRAGFINITVADFDIIDASNLDRQFYFTDQVGMKKVEALKINLLRVNPELKLNIYDKKIDKENIKDIFAGCDIVAECLDTAECKKELVEELMKMKKRIVAVSGLGGIGSSDDIKIHRLKDNFIMIGDLKSDIGIRPALSPRVSVAAAKQADIILEYTINNIMV